MNNNNAIWADGWRTRIQDALQEKGHRSVTNLFAAYPAVPFSRLAERVGIRAAPIQFVSMALAEAKDLKAWHWLVADSLCRHIVGTCSGGWRVGPKCEWKQTLALSSWMSDVLGDSRYAQREEALSIVAKAMIDDHGIDDAWVPSGPCDSVIVRHLTPLLS